MDDWERELDESRRKSETFRRLHRLKQCGFLPDWSVNEVDAIWLKHQGEYPDLIIYPDGKLVAILERAVLHPGAAQDKDRIYNFQSSDAELFDRWLATVKRPTWWQKGAADRERFIGAPLVLLFVLGFSYTLGQIVELGFRTAYRAFVE
jgi:hypothetical protein